MALLITNELVRAVKEDNAFQYRGKVCLNNWIQFSCPFGDNGVWNKVDVHFEYINGHVWLHVENGKLIDNQYVRLLIERNCPNNAHIHWYKSGCRLSKPVNDIQSLKEALFIFHDIFDGPLSDLFEPEAHIETIKEVIQRELVIPTYQRPYCWSPENVRQLLDDINDARKLFRVTNQNYRIGSVILHSINDKNKLKYELVDGQQRITTIALILSICLSESQEFAEYSAINNFKFSNSDAIKAIVQNIEVIKTWFINTDVDKSAFSSFLVENCDVVLIEVKELSEAFQMFDSQNGRGKPLEAYNLLKAYHIGTMTQNSTPEGEQKECDRRWEEAVAYYDNNNKEHKDLLLQLFGHQLFRSREWCKGKWASYFDKTQISEFKGLNSKEASFPYQNALFLFAMLKNSSSIKVKKRFSNGSDPDTMSPFYTLTQDIINGKEFFDYIETYVQMYRFLFTEGMSEKESHRFVEFRKFYNEHCKYPESYHTGETFIREIYKSIIIVLFDKFGEDGLLEYYKDIYSIVYRERVRNYMVKAETADNLAHNSGLFTQIFYAKKISDLENLHSLGKKHFSIKNPDNMSNPQSRENILSFFKDYCGQKLIDNYNG